MKGLLQRVSGVALACFALETGARVAGVVKPTEWIVPYKREVLQNIITWDEETLFVNGERLMLYSGEVHPFRLPVQSLHLDIFQKIKALGYNCVSFYVDWALLEGKPGTYRADGVFDLQPFLDAAKKAGIYLIARPGPYINAEVSGGGFPGWIQRIEGMLRTKAPDYLNATDNYMANVGKIIAANQITEGGPIILIQPENEYTQSTVTPFPDPEYMEYIYKQIRDAGIVVPLISNDASAKGNNAPSQPAPVDIYGHDGYPLGFDCANPSVWPDNALPTNWRTLHLQQSPTTPYSIVEFQGGSFDPWGGPGFEMCATLVGPEFERVFYKQLYSFGVTILNLYMTWGGTNWGNLGHPGGYTSYDYSAVIREDRRVDREKYSEQKLQANFFKVSPAYYTAARGSASTAYTTSSALSVTPAFGTNGTTLYFLRHSTFNTRDSTDYKLTISTAEYGNITVPQFNGTTLTLNGRDSKIHVSDYDLGGQKLVYSTAEIFTWHKYEDKTVLVVYGGPGETHELLFGVSGLEVLEGDLKKTATSGSTLLNFKADGTRKVAKIGGSENPIFVYMLDRNSAYNYWSIDQAPYDNSSPIILKAGYLVRTASLSDSTLTLTGDINATTSIEILGAPSPITTLVFNNATFPLSNTTSTTIPFTAPSLSIPDLSTLPWKYINSLPEISPSYNDSQWTPATLPKSYNSLRPSTTPTSLYGPDYSYHTSSLLLRGHFTATGTESTFFLSAQGGSAFGYSVWLNSTFIGSWRGFDAGIIGNGTYTLPNLTPGQNYVITVVIDNMGLDENWTIGTETMKNPRGILDYALSTRNASAISWKMTGNLGGEDYADLSRGPLNEGAFYVERNGLHLPGAFSSSSTEWAPSNGPVVDGIKDAGIGFFATEFNLNVPKGWDVPLSFTFKNATAASSNSSAASGSSTPAYRAQLYVNGWQYGEYVNNVGPQTKFPVPEGILNYHGTNYVGITLWGLDAGETKLGGLTLDVDGVFWTGMEGVEYVEGESYNGGRKRAY